MLLHAKMALAMNVFMKITDKNTQIFEVVITDGTRSGIQKFDLSELVLKRN